MRKDDFQTTLLFYSVLFSTFILVSTQNEENSTANGYLNIKEGSLNKPRFQWISHDTLNIQLPSLIVSEESKKSIDSVSIFVAKSENKDKSVKLLNIKVPKSSGQIMGLNSAYTYDAYLQIDWVNGTTVDWLHMKITSVDSVSDEHLTVKLIAFSVTTTPKPNSVFRNIKDGALISVKNNNQVNVYTLNNLFTPIISIPVNLTQRIIAVHGDLKMNRLFTFHSDGAMKQFSLIHGNQIEDIMFHNISFEDILFPWVEYDWLNGKFYFLRHNSIICLDVKNLTFSEIQMSHNNSEEKIINYAVDPFNGFIFVVKKSVTVNKYKLERFLLPDINQSNNNSNKCLESNRQKYFVNINITSLQCKPLETRLIILLPNNSLIQLDYEFNLIKDVKLITSDCKSHFEPIYSERIKLFQIKLGYIIFNYKTNTMFLLESPSYADSSKLACHEMSHLTGSPIVVITKEQQFTPTCSTSLRDISTMFLENKAFLSWRSCIWNKQYKNPSGWHKWSYLLHISSKNSSNITSLVEQKYFNETMKYEISDLSRNTHYQLFINVQQSNERFSMHQETLNKDLSVNLLTVDENYAHIYILLNGNWIFTYSFVHDFHRSIKDVILHKSQIWILLKSGDVYLGLISDKSISSALKLANNFPWSQVKISNYTEFASVNWAHLTNIKASRIVLDRRWSDLYFTSPSTKWIYRWTLSPYQHDIYGNSLENVVYGYPTLIQQSPVIDFVVDSKHNHLIWIASYLDSSAAVFSKKLGHSDRVSLIQKINYLSSNSIPKFLIQDFDSLNRFYYTVESYQTVQKDSHHVKNLTSIWKMPGLKKDSDKCIKHENASLTLCPMNTSWLLESKPSILGNSGISIELLANQQLIWTSLKWNTFFELFSHNKYSHNSIYAYNLEPGLSNCSSIQPTLSAYASYDFTRHQSVIDFSVCFLRNRVMSLVDSNSVDAVLTMGRYKIKGEINVMNAFVNRICVVQSVNRSNDLIQRYVSLPDILGSDLCSYVYFNEITVHGCLPDKFIDFHELSKSNKVTEKVIKQMVSWKGDAIDSTINVILGEDTHVKSFVINHGVSLYSGDLKTRVYFTNDYRKPTSEAEFSNYKLHHELKTNSGNFTQNILISPLDDTFRRVMFSLDWCYYGSIYTVECSSHHLTDVDLWLHICQLGQYAVEHWFELKNDSNDEVETLTDNEEALCGYDYTNLFTYIFINNKKIPTIHAEMLTTKRLIYIAIKTGVFFHLDLGIVWKTNLRDRVDTSSSGYLNHMDKSAKVCVPVNIQTALENLDKINFSIHWERKELIVFHENAGVIFKSPLDDCSFNERDFDHCSSTTVSNLTCLSNRYILTKCTVEEFRSIWHPQPFIVKIYLEHRGVSNLENIETEILVSLQDKRLYFTDMQYTESTDKMDSTITTILPSANLTVLLSNSNQTEVEDFQFPKDDVPKPPLLIVKPFQCHSLPGKFVLQCYRREIRFTWIPPDDKIAKAMVKFREFHQPKFTTMSDYGWGHSGVKFRNHTIASLKPNRFYEFGLNLIYENSTFDRFPKIGSKDLCTCKTYPDVPDVPLNLRYHYIQGNQYNLEWTPNNDNGEPIFTYNMKSMPIIPSNTEHSKWVSIAPHNLTDKQANITLDTNHQSAFQLRAVNKVGMSEPAYLVIRPPFQKVPDKGYSSLFQPLNQVTSLLTYSLLSVALLLLLLFLIVLLIYRRRHKDGKSNKHSFFISFNPARRLHSSSGNGSSILGLGSDLTTSGLPLDLATLEPLWNQEVNSLYGISKPDLNNFEQVPQIPAANIRFLRYIGCGAFGKVWEGWLHVRDADGERFEKVALKVRNCKSLTEAEFKREATLMHKYQHTNIVRFFGVSFDSPGQQCLVLEMMDQGNLRDYLHRSRPRIAPDIAANVFAAAAICAAAGKTGGSDGSSMNTSMTSTAAGGGTPSASNVITLTAQLDLPALVAIMRDICHGCRYLEEQHFVHRDIAARNCLVSHNHSSGRIVKLCDFGLARDIYKNDYYRKRNEPKLPVRWMSPEAIRDGLFTTKSDVWAYAVTCWEVLTLGADPFYGRANVDVMNLVIGGHVLGRPENCPEELYNQLLQCWSRFTEMRPTFGQLCKKMDEFILASQNGQSPFAQPFVVSLPLPKSLQGGSGQQASIYDSNKPQHHESNDLSLGMLSNNGQHRTSLDGGHPVSDMDSLLINETNLSHGMSSSKQLLLSSSTSKDLKPSTFHSKSRSYAEAATRGYIVTPGVEGISMNKFNYRESRIENQIYTSSTAPLTGAYECSMSDPSTEQTTLATTSNGTESNRQTSIKSKSRSLHENTENTIDKNLHSTNATHPQQRQQPFNQSPSKKFGVENLVRHQSDSKPNPYKTLGYQDIKSTNVNKYNAFSSIADNQNDNKSSEITPFNYTHTHSKSMNSKSASMVDTMPHSSSGSTNNRSLTAYWLMETGGGVDSLGYERPSLIRTSFPSQTNSVTSNSENNNVSTFIDQNCNNDFLERVICSHQSLRKTKVNPLTT